MTVDDDDESATYGVDLDDLPQFIFTDSTCWPILRRILLFCVDGTSSCMFVSGNRCRTPRDTEMYLREQALQQLSPTLVRCVHSEEAIAVRDGYMVTARRKRTPTGKGSITGFTVWALPQWHDVRKAHTTNRDPSLTPRADPLPVNELPMPPRPAGAIANQNLWTWEYDLSFPKQCILTAAIFPEDNLLAVVTVCRVTFTSQDGSETVEGRRWVIHLFQLRPLGLAGRQKWADDRKPVPHPKAVQSTIEVIEPLRETCDLERPVRLKIGPDGRLALLLLSCTGEERSGPLLVWDWMRAKGIGFFPSRAFMSEYVEYPARCDKSNFLDFAFYTRNSVVVLEAYEPAIDELPDSCGSTTPLPPFKVRLSVFRLDCHETEDNQIFDFPPPEEHSAWIIESIKPAEKYHLVSCALPSTIHTVLEAPVAKPLASLAGRLSMYPVLTQEYCMGSLSFTLWSKEGFNTPATTPQVRGSVPAGVLQNIFSKEMKIGHIESMIDTWITLAAHCYMLQDYTTSRAQEKMVEALRRIADANDEREKWIWEDEIVAGDFYLTNARDIFQHLMCTADEIAKANSGTEGEITITLTDNILADGVRRHTELFMAGKPGLSSNIEDAVDVPFNKWCDLVDIFVTRPSPPQDVYGARMVYLDFDSSDLVGNRVNKDTLPADLTDIGCHLAVRTHNLTIVWFPRSCYMDAAQQLWKDGPISQWGDVRNQELSSTRETRYVACVGLGCAPDKYKESDKKGRKRKKQEPNLVHTPWLGPQVRGSRFWSSRPPVLTDLSGPCPLSVPITELRSAMVLDKSAYVVSAVFFDGQSIVIAQVNVSPRLR